MLVALLEAAKLCQHCCGIKLCPSAHRSCSVQSTALLQPSPHGHTSTSKGMLWKSSSGWCPASGRVTCLCPCRHSKARSHLCRLKVSASRPLQRGFPPWVGPSQAERPRHCEASSELLQHLLHHKTDCTQGPLRAPLSQPKGMKAPGCVCLLHGSCPVCISSCLQHMQLCGSATCSPAVWKTLSPGTGIKDTWVQTFFPSGCSGQSFASRKRCTNLPTLLSGKKRLLLLDQSGKLSHMAVNLRGQRKAVNFVLEKNRKREMQIVSYAKKKKTNRSHPCYLL